MARPQREGLDYFPLDVDMDNDDKIALIEAKHGITAFGIIIKLLMKVYANGYFYQWTEKEQLLFSRRVNVDINKVNDIINDALEWEIFDKNLYDKYNILTSCGIQKRYLSATSRRKQVQITRQFILAPSAIVNDCKNLVIVDINNQSVVVNGNDGTQSKVKESKGKESNVSHKKIIDSLRKNVRADIRKDEIDLVTSWLDDGIETDVVIWAIEQAATNKKRNVQYINGILRNLHSENVLTMEGVKEREKSHKKPEKEERFDFEKYKEEALRLVAKYDDAI